MSEFGGAKRICLCESYPSDVVGVSFSIVVPNANRNDGVYESSAYPTETNPQSVKTARAHCSELRIQLFEFFAVLRTVMAKEPRLTKFGSRRRLDFSTLPSRKMVATSIVHCD
jgi:hypothetical protein